MVAETKPLYRDEQQLMRLIDEALLDREKKRKKIREMQTMALGDWSSMPSIESPENLAFAMAAFLLPSLPSNIRSRLTSSGTPASRMAATAMQGSTNQVLRQQRVGQVLTPNKWDYAYGWAAAFVEIAPTDRSDPSDAERAQLKGSLSRGISSPSGPADPSARLKPEWPSVKYLHGDRYFHDSKATVKTEWEFQGHMNVEAKTALVERAKADPDSWNLAEVMKLTTQSSGEAQAMAMARGERIVDRHKSLYYVVYLPNAVLDGRPPGPWESGVIVTIAPISPMVATGGGSGREGCFIRKPYYYKGHPGGPYVHAGQYVHTEDTFPVTTLLANSKTVHMLNAAASSLFQRIREHQVQHLYDARYKEAIEEMRRSGDGSWTAVPNFMKDSIITVESGGPTQAEVAEYDLLQKRAAANLAMDDEHRGAASPGTTATAIREVSETIAAQQGHRVEGWRTFLKDIVERIVAHIAISDRFFIHLDEAGREDYRRVVLEMATPHLERALAGRGVGGELTSAEVERVIARTRAQAIPFVGGDLAGRPSGWYELDLSISIESDTTGGIEAKRREAEIDALLEAYGQRMVTQPHINWKQRAAEHFAAIGVPGMERLIDEKRASALVQMQLMSQEPIVTSERQIGAPQEANGPSGRGGNTPVRAGAKTR